MQEYAGDLQVVLLSGLLGFVLLWIAKAKGFFQYPHVHEKNPVYFKTVFSVFCIYLGMTMLVAPLLAQLVRSFVSPSHLNAVLGVMQLLFLLAMLILFYLFCRSQHSDLFKKIWKNRSFSHVSPISVDIGMGLLAWILSFPFVIAVGQLADLLLHVFFGFENYEQVAVVYLKGTLSSPFLLTIALLTILLAAPIIEEFLFRGCLQSFFKNHMSPKWAIILSALCFSLFHFAPSQGLGNFSLLSSLFVFALFLGFIYERQASLFASIALHMTFNAVSTCRILFFP